MGHQIKNNAYGTLSAGITDVATSISLTAGHGARFPAAGAGVYFYATLVDTSGDVEIVLVSNRSTDTLTVVRAQDSTTGRAYSAGDRLELRPCNVITQALQQESVVAIASSGTDTYTGTLAPAPTAYNSNQVYAVKFVNTNTSTAPTLNLNSLGAKTIKRRGSLALVAGDLTGFHFLHFDGTDLIVLNPATLGIATATSINKVTLTAPATSATITIADGKTFTASGTITLAGTDGKTLTVSNNLTLAGTDGTTVTFPSVSAHTASLDIESQALTGGVAVTSKSLGTISSGTVTPDPSARPLQHYTNGGAHTLAPSATKGTTVVEMTNNGSAGALTTSSFTKVVGDALTTTNGHKFLFTIVISQTYSLLQVQALQ